MGFELLSGRAVVTAAILAGACVSTQFAGSRAGAQNADPSEPPAASTQASAGTANAQP